MVKKDITGVIPARFKSTRLPGKPLLKIDSRSMIQMVYENCKKSKLLSRVIVATDDQRIFDHVLSFGGLVVMTDEKISSGTDRCFSALKGLSPDIVVNIQGDEPLINPDVIDKTITSLLNNEEAVCATPISQSDDKNEINSPNCVKVVIDKKSNALYFSRSPIPFYRSDEKEYFLHIGLYAFRYNFLQKYVKMVQTDYEIAESLEQLRILENGFKISCCKVDYKSIGVDTQEDLERVRELAVNFEV